MIAKVAVLGSPISHSLSPKLHNYWLQKYNIEGKYYAMETKAENLYKTICNLEDRGFVGVNLTVPLKQEILNIIDDIDEFSRKISAVNIVIFKNGKRIGFNSDSYGFIENLKYGIKLYNCCEIENYLDKVVVLGAGGAARAVIAGLIKCGAGEIFIANRSLDRAINLVDDFDCDNLVVSPWEERDNLLENTGLLVNTTSLGMVGQPDLNIKLDKLPNNALVTDIVYNPLDTKLLITAKSRGNKVVDGLGMLLFQGQMAFEKFFGVIPDVNDDLRNLMI